MAKYNLHLKGYVGGNDFNASGVESCLRDNADNDVTVLIDSTGGQLATALSIAAAFRNHGAVDVHFVGLNASAATVASLGARTISIDRAAMYLVHKCSNVVFKWESMNADELADYIDKLTQNKADLDKIDDNIAAFYASRCRKDKKELLALMEKGAWLNAKEAFDWGFVDKITDFDADDAPTVTASLADDFKAAGIPVPESPEKKSRGLSSIFTALREFINSGRQSTPEAHSPQNSAGPEQSAQSKTPDTAADQTVEHVENAVDNSSPEDNSSLEGNSSPEDDPEPSSNNVLDTGQKSEADMLGSFISTGVSARKLFNSLP